MPKKIDREVVQHMAKLSRLKLSGEEEEKFSNQLSSILEYVEQLNEVKTDGVETMANIAGLSNVFREDKVEVSGITHEDIAKNAPEFENGAFVVPGVFE